MLWKSTFLHDLEEIMKLLNFDFELLFRQFIFFAFAFIAYNQTIQYCENIKPLFINCESSYHAIEELLHHIFTLLIKRWEL